jgi:two-component system chemotaxis response regulator CheY
MGGSILIVDDSASLRQVLRMALEEAGYQVREAADGQDALARLAEAPADVVVSDLHMPRLDGLGLLRALAGEGSRPRIPVVMLTTSSERPELREACMELGASAWVLKLFPFDSRELRAVLAALLHPSEQAGRFA